jgi:sugar-specific transcriptional regulator TrmB
MFKKLQDFGLSEKEAKVYIASLELGKATVDKIAKQAGIKRPTTYVQIKSLMQKGLMSVFEEERVACYAPESPESLKRLFAKERQELDAKEKELTETLPELARLFQSAGERPIVRFFDGREGILTMREQMLSAPAKEWLVIYSHDALDAVFPEAERRAYSKRRIEKGITSKLIYTRAEGPFPPEERKITKFTEIKFFPPNKLPLESDVVIFGNSVALTTLKGRLFSIIIESKELAKGHAALFWALWNQQG